MPFVRLQIICGWCDEPTSIINGNPDLATKAIDSPVVQDARGAMFICPKCKAKHRIPLRQPEVNQR